MKPAEARPELRGAIYRRDAAAILAVLREVEPSALLQLGGDGLLIALDQDAQGATGMTWPWIRALRERSWDGDLELADQLAAQLGGGPTPMLRPLPVDLDQLADLLEGDPLDGGGRVDVRTGDVWPGPAIEYAVEIGEENEDELEASWWLPVESEGSRAGYRDMQDFITTMPDPDRGDRLGIAIQGRGAFRRFKDVLARWPGELERWHGFCEERQRGRARAWLAGAGYCVAGRAGPAAR